MIGYAFCAPQSFAFGTDGTVVKFMLIVAVLEQTLHCFFIMAGTTSVQVCIDLEYKNFIMLVFLSSHVASLPEDTTLPTKPLSRHFQVFLAY